MVLRTESFLRHRVHVTTSPTYADHPFPCCLGLTPQIALVQRSPDETAWKLTTLEYRPVNLIGLVVSFGIQPLPSIRCLDRSWRPSLWHQYVRQFRQMHPTRLGDPLSQSADRRRSSVGIGISGPCSLIRRLMFACLRRSQKLQAMSTLARCCATSPSRMEPWDGI
jgi:hypothetical protein